MDRGNLAPKGQSEEDDSEGMRFTSERRVMPLAFGDAIQIHPVGPLRFFVLRRVFAYVARRLGVYVTADADEQTTNGDLDQAKIVIRRESAMFSRIARSGVAGFLEAYMAGEWWSNRLVAVLSRGAVGLKVVATWPVVGAYAKLSTVLRRKRPIFEATSADNAAWHYDLPPEFFLEFLDEGLNYSSAYFQSTSDSLYLAQTNKIRLALDNGLVSEGADVLEIGCGWGSVAIAAAQRGARVRSISLAKRQVEYATRRAAAYSVGGVEFAHMDYRDAGGQYDTVISIEMIEAVGYDRVPEFFRVVRERLRPGGRLVLQFIHTSDTRMKLSLDRATWIRKYIFAGGDILSRQYILDCAEKQGLRLRSSLEMGYHYARTLKAWRERLEGAYGKGRIPYCDEVAFRMWTLYMSMSEAGFRAGVLGCAQWCLVNQVEER